MPRKCASGPLRMAKEHRKRRLPQVNERANFCGRIEIMGRPTAKAKRKKMAERMRRAQNIWKRGRGGSRGIEMNTSRYILGYEIGGNAMFHHVCACELLVKPSP